MDALEPGVLEKIKIGAGNALGFLLLPLAWAGWGAAKKLVASYAAKELGRTVEKLLEAGDDDVDAWIIHGLQLMEKKIPDEGLGQSYRIQTAARVIASKISALKNQQQNLAEVLEKALHSADLKAKDILAKSPVEIQVVRKQPPA